jgi:hypothetical protein
LSFAAEGIWATMSGLRAVLRREESDDPQVEFRKVPFVFEEEGWQGEAEEFGNV